MKEYLLLFMCSIFCLAACGDDVDLPEDHIVLSSKIIAIKIEEPEVMQGDTVSMKLLIAGHDMDQNSEMPVTWIIGEDSDYQLASLYNEPLELSIPEDVLEEDDSVDVPVIAMVTIGSKTLLAEKLFRVTNNPVGKNPVVSGVRVDSKAGFETQARTITNGETITIGSGTVNFACTSITEELPDAGNEKLVYRWYISKSSNSGGQIEVSHNQDHIDALLGAGAEAAEFRQSVVYSVAGQLGLYSVYLVVRDNRSNSTDSSQDRLGTDFFYFSINVE